MFFPVSVLILAAPTMCILSPGIEIVNQKVPFFAKLNNMNNKAAII